METRRPVLLIDIDGVLNVYGVDECPEGYSEFDLFPGDGEPARLCPLHGERPAAWLDDVVTPEAGAWAHDRAAPTILVEVDHRTGLERRHVDALLDWSTQVRAVRAS